MGSLFSRPDPPKPVSPPAREATGDTKADPAVAQAGRDQRRRAASARGRSSTVLGASESFDPGQNTRRKTLLGE